MAITPHCRSASVSEASLTRAPRSLNELVTWRFSYLTNTSAPVRAESLGAGSIGVRSTWPARTGRAASTSANPTFGLPLLNRASNGLANPIYGKRERARRHPDASPNALVKPVFVPILLGGCDRLPNHGCERAQTHRRVVGSQPARLRPGPQPRAVRGRGGAPRRRLPDRLP